MQSTIILSMIIAIMVITKYLIRHIHHIDSRSFIRNKSGNNISFNYLHFIKKYFQMDVIFFIRKFSYKGRHFKILNYSSTLYFNWDI